jgi:hypothetical protein
MAKKFLIFFSMFPLFVYSQTDHLIGLELPVKGTYVRTTIYQGDTIPYAVLPTINCYGIRTFKTAKQQEVWTRTKYNVKIVYPYAILAAAKLKEYDRILAQMSESERSKYTKQMEDQLKSEFSDELKKLTVNQGKILIKLIDRETGKTTYSVVKELRGSFSAFMYQGVALMFSSNLKSEYDPLGDDKMIEDAIKLVESGEF